MKKTYTRKQSKACENSGSKKLLNEIISDINVVDKAGVTVGQFIDQIEKTGATSFKVVLDEEDEDGDEKALRYNKYLSMKNLSIRHKDAMVKLNFSSYLPSNVARDAASGFSLKQFENGFAKNLGSEYRDFILRFHLSDGSFFFYEPVMPAQFLPYKKNPKCCIVVMKHAQSVLKKQDVPLDEEESGAEETVKTPSTLSEEEDFIKWADSKLGGSAYSKIVSDEPVEVEGAQRDLDDFDLYEYSQQDALDEDDFWDKVFEKMHEDFEDGEEVQASKIISWLEREGETIAISAFESFDAGEEYCTHVGRYKPESYWRS